MPTQHDVVMVGTVLSQKDRGLAPPAAVGVLVQLVESVREPWAAEQRAASIALGDVSGARRVRIRHARAGAATFGICREQGRVSAVEVVNLLPELDKQPPHTHMYRDPEPAFPLGLLSMTPVADRGLARA